MQRKKRTGMSIIVILFVGTFLIFAGVREIIFHFRDIKEYRKFEKIADIGIATILEKVISHHPGGRLAEYIVYEFEDDKGQKYKRYEPVSIRDYKLLKEGDRIAVLYNPYNPADVRFWGMKGLSVNRRKVAWPIILGVGMIFFVWVLGCKY